MSPPRRINVPADQPAQQSVSLIDAHVHLHARAHPGALLSAAERNFRAIASRLGLPQWQGVLLLAEMANQHWFEDIAAGATTAGLEHWTLKQPESGQPVITLENGVSRLTVVAGRQIVTAERIEVLALGTRASLPDGEPLEPTIARAHDAGALVVLPWGVGKWLGQRGRLVANALLNRQGRPVLAGDNGGRPSLWPEPPVFTLLRSRGLPVLPGTDPLPIPGEEEQVGRYGFWIAERLPASFDGRTLEDILVKGGTDAVHPFGRRETIWRFFRNQLALRINKH